MVFKEEILSVLRCPRTGEKLVYDSGKLINRKKGVFYPVEDGIPILLGERVEKLD